MYSEDIKNEVIADLSKISNQQIKVPVKGYNTFSISQLIKEVENDTHAAEVFIEDWLNTKELTASIQLKNRMKKIRTAQIVLIIAFILVGYYITFIR